MNVLLFQLDGALPNLALMRIAAHHRGRGDAVELRRATKPRDFQRNIWDSPDAVYGSAIFEKTRPLVAALKRAWPAAIVGGSGFDEAITLADIGIGLGPRDYSDYPTFRQSIGFTQRGCRLACSFCKVPGMEGKVRHENTIAGIWRGEPWPREVVLLDNDFFGERQWPARIAELQAGRFKVNFNQGINVRFLNDESAAAIASVNYRDARMDRKRIHTAWDNRKDERTVFRGLEALTRHGVKPDEIMVYVLVGYDHDTQTARPTLTVDDFHRHARLVEFGCRPYPMPFVRTRQLVGFQRWIVLHGAYHKRVRWDEWEAAGYEPRKLEVMK